MTERIAGPSQRALQEGEVEALPHLVGPHVPGQTFGVEHRGLGDHQALRGGTAPGGAGCESSRARQVAEEGMEFVPVVVGHQVVARQVLVLAGSGVGQPRFLEERVRDVDAETVDAAVQPVPQHPSKSATTSGSRQFRSGCCGACRCRYHSPSAAAVQAGPPNADCQSFGGNSPLARAGRGSARGPASRVRPPTPRGTTGGASEVWLGTRSMSTFRPSACARPTSASKSPGGAEIGRDRRVVGDVVAAVGQR